MSVLRAYSELNKEAKFDIHSDRLWLHFGPKFSISRRLLLNDMPRLVVVYTQSRNRVPRIPVADLSPVARDLIVKLGSNNEFDVDLYNRIRDGPENSELQTINSLLIRSGYRDAMNLNLRLPSHYKDMMYKYRIMSLEIESGNSAMRQPILDLLEQMYVHGYISLVKLRQLRNEVEYALNEYTTENA